MNWAERNEAWEGRARALGRRAVLHVGHKTVEQQDEITRKQNETIIPLFKTAVQDAFPYAMPEMVLDFGCGVGRWTSELASLTGADVLGVDPTEQFLEVCRQEHTQSDPARPIVSFAKYENGRIPSGEHQFDVVWACMVLSTILDVSGGMYDHTLREIKRVMRPRALMFLIDNTLGRGGREVRSPYSISRTVEQYITSFREIGVNLEVKGQYEDLGEINTIFAGMTR